MFDADLAIDNFRKRDEAARALWSHRAASLIARLPGVVAALRTQFGVTEVWLFGSLARGDFGASSDVDLAVRGLDPDRYWRALGVACQMLGCEVDLVPLEGAPSSLVDTLRVEGRSL